MKLVYEELDRLSGEPTGRRRVLPATQPVDPKRLRPVPTPQVLEDEPYDADLFVRRPGESGWEYEQRPDARGILIERIDAKIEAARGEASERMPRYQRRMLRHLVLESRAVYEEVDETGEIPTKAGKYPFLEAFIGMAAPPIAPTPLSDVLEVARGVQRVAAWAHERFPLILRRGLELRALVEKHVEAGEVAEAARAIEEAELY